MRQAEAIDREREKVAHTNREYDRATGRKLRAEGWDVAQRADGSWQCVGSAPNESGRGNVITPCQSFRDYERAESIWQLPTRTQEAQR